MTAVPTTCDTAVPEQGDDEMHDPDELVDNREIESRLGVANRTATIWSQRHADFPRPVERVGRRDFRRWGDVESWYDQRAARLGAGPRARMQGKGRRAVTDPLPKAEETKLRRELVAIGKRLVQAEQDKARMVEVCTVLFDRAGLTWQQLGDISGMNRAAIRKAVERARGG